MISLENYNVEKLPALAVAALKAHHLTVAAAESCTGGYLAKRLTDVSGASAVLEGSIVTYAPRIKEQFALVPHKTIEACGVVSPETAAAMAEGIRKTVGADIGIGITGIAGPDGGTEDKPVGLVYIGCATADKTVTEKLLLAPITKNPREYIRYMTTNYALKLILDALGD